MILGKLLPNMKQSKPSKDEINENFDRAKNVLFALEEFLGQPGTYDRIQVYRLRIELANIRQNVLDRLEKLENEKC